MSRIMTWAISFVVLTAVVLVCRADPSGEASDEPGMAGFSGVLSHDFGRIPFRTPMADLRHEFVLVNTSGRTREITAVRASCGCLDAQPSTMLVGPGESLRINAVIKVSSPGVRAATIHLMMRDGSVLRLDATVTAVPERDVVVSHKAVLFTEASRQRAITITATSMSGNAPDPISWRGPSGLQVRTAGWRRIFTSDGDLLPARHELVLHLEARHDSEFQSPLHLLVEGDDIPVGLNGWPWDVCAIADGSVSRRTRSDG